jgi:hypothetical protein
VRNGGLSGFIFAVIFTINYLTSGRHFNIKQLPANARSCIMTYGLFMKSNVVPAAFVYFLESKNPNKSIVPLLKGDGGGGRKRKSEMLSLTKGVPFC